MGGVIGVGLAENLNGAGLNALLFLKIALSWVLSFVLSGFVCAFLFAVCESYSIYCLAQSEKHVTTLHAQCQLWLVGWFEHEQHVQPDPIQENK